MPLRKGGSKEIVKYNIGELMRSGTFAKDKSKKKKRSMAIAAAFSQSRRK